MTVLDFVRAQVSLCEVIVLAGGGLIRGVGGAELDIVLSWQPHTGVELRLSHSVI